MLIHKPSIILISLFCGWPCFYFLEYKKGTKRISIRACQANCSLFRGREWLNLCQQNYSFHTISLELENQCPVCDLHSPLSSVSTVGSNSRSDSQVYVGPQLLGSTFMMKGKHAAAKDLELCSRSEGAPSCDKLPVKSPGHQQNQSYLLRRIRQPRASIKLCL